MHSSRGYAYRDRVAIGFFGEVFRAHDAEGREVRIVHVDPELLRESVFVATLTAQRERLRGLDHERVVATRALGRSGTGQVRVITDPVLGPVSAEELLRESGGGGLAPEVALAIGLSVVKGLAYAHSLGIIHGCVHPRSVLVDFHGQVKLADFGLARAYAEAVIHSEGPKLSESSASYLAPELALGSEPTIASDVYATGALLFALLAGRPPPGELSAPRRIEEIIERALASDGSSRFLNATDLEEHLEEAITQEGASVALATDVAHFVVELRSRSEASLDKETEDLLSHLGPREDPPPPSGRPLSELLSDLEEEDPEEERGLEPPKPVSTVEWEALAPSPRVESLPSLSASGPAASAPAAPSGAAPAPSAPRPRGGGLVEESVFSLDDATDVSEPPSGVKTFETLDTIRVSARQLAEPGGTGDHTAVDQDPDELLNNHISNVIRASQPEQPVLGEEPNTPLPEPMAHHERPGSVTRVAGTGAWGMTTSKEPAAASWPVAAKDPLSLDSAPEAETSRRAGRTLFLLAITVFVLASLFGVVYTQTDIFHPERAREEEERRAQEREEALEALRDDQPVPGEIAIDSTPGQAAVWLLLGRTPLDSLKVPAAAVHQLRLEHDGYVPLDLAVSKVHWTEDDEGEVRAEVRGRLSPGAPEEALPAYPPEPDSKTTGVEGAGSIHVESEPSGAQVWLLVGFTPEARLVGIEAGQTYEFKLLKDGFRPGFAVVKEDDWYLSGPDGPVRRTMTRAVELAPIAEKPARRRRRSKDD